MEFDEILTEEVEATTFELRALKYFSTGKGGEAEADSLAKAIEKQRKLWPALTRAWADATDNAVGEIEVKRVMARIQLVIVKQVGGPEEYLTDRMREVAFPPPH